MKAYNKETGKSLNDLCYECTGDGWMAGGVPCKICKGTGKLTEDQNKAFEESVNKISCKKNIHQTE